MSQKNLLQHSSIQLLRKAIRREWRLKLAASLLLLAFGLGFAYFSFGAHLILSAFGMICTLLGLRFVFHLIRENRAGSPRLMYLLEHNPRHIVWVYSVVTERLPFGLQLGSSCTMYFKLLDGDDISVGLSARNQQRVSLTLNHLLPHATFGYTRDREQWYMADPAMLLRHGEE
ncbi:MAG: hypothetical protein J5I94_24415 [Phaeodactylibacter sp.]|nr:hypothetical protein [Phaeodactylibacter sp.]